ETWMRSVITADRTAARVECATRFGEGVADQRELRKFVMANSSRAVAAAIRRGERQTRLAYEIGRDGAAVSCRFDAARLRDHRDFRNALVHIESEDAEERAVVGWRHGDHGVRSERKIGHD